MLDESWGQKGGGHGGGGAGWKLELATFLSPEAHTKLLNITKNPEGSGKQLIHFDQWIRTVDRLSSGSLFGLGQGQQRKESRQFPVPESSLLIGQGSHTSVFRLDGVWRT